MALQEPGHPAATADYCSAAAEPVGPALAVKTVEPVGEPGSSATVAPAVPAGRARPKEAPAEPAACS